jgi:hypothetical protein
MDNDKRNELNRKICLRLISELKSNGWVAIRADDEDIKGLKPAEKVEMVFQLDGAEIVFAKGGKTHFVSFTPYNIGTECISDWSFCKNDADGFGKIVDVISSGD